MDIVTRDNKPSFLFYNPKTGKNHRLISENDEFRLNESITNIRNFFVENPAESLKGKSTAEIDTAVAELLGLFEPLKKSILETQISVYLLPEQVDNLAFILGREMTYTAGDLPLVIEVYHSLYGEESKNSNIFIPYKTSNKPKTTSEVLELKFRPIELNNIYALLLKHTVKGMSKNTELFYSVIMSFNQSLKAISYYDINMNAFQQDFMKWASDITGRDLSQQ